MMALDRIRHRIPFAYWLVYDVVVFCFEAYAVTHFSPWFLISFAFLAVATFFDIVEAIVKWPHAVAESAAPSGDVAS